MGPLRTKRRSHALRSEPLDPSVPHALGYHGYDSYLIYFDRKQLILAPEVGVLDQKGGERNMTEQDLTEILLKTPKTKDGRYRALATVALPGKNVGPFLFHGIRWDDVNDSVPHAPQYQAASIRNCTDRGIF